MKRSQLVFIKRAWDHITLSKVKAVWMIQKRFWSIKVRRKETFDGKIYKERKGNWFLLTNKSFRLQKVLLCWGGCSFPFISLKYILRWNSIASYSSESFLYWLLKDAQNKLSYVYIFGVNTWILRLLKHNTRSLSTWCEMVRGIVMNASL